MTRAEWRKWLGHRAPGSEFVPETRLLRTFDAPEFAGELYAIRTEPDVFERTLVMLPRERPAKSPAVLMPFYYPERIAGCEFDPPYAPYPPEKQLIAWGAQLVRKGYVVYAPETWHLNLVPDGDRDDFSRWRRGAERLKLRHPDWTGVGKLLHDAQLALDAMAADPRVDTSRMAVAGHSLGGKIAFYAGCFDDRLKTMICSDFGNLWEQTNWSDPWYWGDKVEQLRAAWMDHAQLRRTADKPMFLIAGKFDDERSRSSLLPDDGFFNHATGHTPTAEANEAAWAFLARQLG